jgi:hypothetical protein
LPIREVGRKTGFEQIIMGNKGRIYNYLDIFSAEGYRTSKIMEEESFI